MKKVPVFSALLCLSAVLGETGAWAQDATDGTLHVLRPSVNADADSAELCLEFDKALATMTVPGIRLETGGKTVVPQNIATTDASLCLSPLEHGKDYHITLTGARGAQEEKLAEPYSLSFKIPDREPSLAFLRPAIASPLPRYGEDPILRAVNVPQVRLELYRVTDAASMARAWQDREQSAIAPSESVYFARNKGQKVWQGDQALDGIVNETVKQKLSLRAQVPDLAPGLYLLVANGIGKTETQGLAPLAAEWLARSDLSIHAVRDADGVHVFTDETEAGKANPEVAATVRLIALNNRQESVGEAQAVKNGGVLLPLKKPDEVRSVIAVSDRGDVAFADLFDITPQRAATGASGARIVAADPFYPPGAAVNLSLITTAPKEAAPSQFDLLREDRSLYARLTVPAGAAALSFAAPPSAGLWGMRWQRNDGTALAESVLRVTNNPDLPRLQTQAEPAAVSADTPVSLTVTATTSAGKPAATVAGQVRFAWHRVDRVFSEWKDYRFGTPAASVDAPSVWMDFMTDPQGAAHLRGKLPPPPDAGFYQAVLTAVAAPDSGVAAAPPIALTLKPEASLVGIKPAARESRFAQNSLARFDLIALSSEGRPRDLQGIAYQIYEEGRSFDWQQDEGRWTYKRQPQLRHLGGGSLTIKGDGSSYIEWPLTIGAYRLVLTDAQGKMLAQASFSAGWNALANAAPSSAPLDLTVPDTLHAGREEKAGFLLSEPMTVTALVADSHIRKVIRRVFPQGANTVAFTPEEGWEDRVGITLLATAPTGATQSHAESTLARGKDKADVAADHAAAPAALIAAVDPASVPLRVGGSGTLVFGLANTTNTRETYRYVVTPTNGVKIDGAGKGTVTLGDKQSQSLFLSVTGLQTGAHDIKLEVSGAHNFHTSLQGTVVVERANVRMETAATTSLSVGQAFVPQDMFKPHAAQDAVLLAAQLPTEGLAETLDAALRARPFTTRELSASLVTLRQWGGVMTRMGLLAEPSLSARRQDLVLRLLRHQNPDGGFSALRDGDSAMAETAEALTALNGENADRFKPILAAATTWLKQKLSNTWFKESERPARAVAYDALAQAGALDAASLRYFVDTGNAAPLSAVAAAQIGDAFARLGDPEAAADAFAKARRALNTETPDVGAVALLAENKALPRDAVRDSMQRLAPGRKDGADVTALAAYLRAFYAGGSANGLWRVVQGGETRDVDGVFVMRNGDKNASAPVRNAEASNLFVSLAHAARSGGARESGVTRRVYRLNGVELSAQAQPVRGETYLVVLEGTAQALPDGARLLIQEQSAAALRPSGCPISPKLDTMGFMPWFTTRDLTGTDACEAQPYGFDALLSRGPAHDGGWSVAYLTTINAQSIGDLDPPQVRVLNP